jgi:hypothetical protein
LWSWLNRYRTAVFWDFLSYLDLLDYRAHSDAFSEMAGFSIDFAGLSTGASARRIAVGYVTGNYFSMLGVQPAVGRLIVPTEGQHVGADPVIVLGHGFWQREFGGTPDIVGKNVKLNGRRFTVIGVADKSFRGTVSILELDAYVPLSMVSIAPRLENLWTERDARALQVLAYPRPNVSLEQAEASLNVVAAQLAKEYPATNHAVKMRVLYERLARPTPSVAEPPSPCTFLVPYAGGAGIARRLRERRQSHLGARHVAPERNLCSYSAWGCAIADRMPVSDREV